MKTNRNHAVTIWVERVKPSKNLAMNYMTMMIVVVKNAMMNAAMRINN